MAREDHGFEKAQTDTKKNSLGQSKNSILKWPNITGSEKELRNSPLCSNEVYLYLLSRYK